MTTQKCKYVKVGRTWYPGCRRNMPEKKRTCTPPSSGEWCPWCGSIVVI